MRKNKVIYKNKSDLIVVNDDDAHQDVDLRGVALLL